MTPFVSVITVNYNGLRFLEKFFGALEELDYPRDRFEVLFVDNASVDDSVAEVETRWPWARVIRAPKNLGFAGGNNLGYEHAKGDLIALLNNDTAVEPAWLTELVAAIESDPRLGMSTSKILFMDKPDEINNVGLNLYRSGAGGDRGFHEKDNGQYDEEAEVFGGCGASVLLRREMLEDVGFFDPSFFMYYEDLDLAWRARLRGWKCLYTPRSIVHHVHCGSSEEWSPFFTYYVERNRIFTNLKNNGRWRTVLRTIAGVGKRTLIRGLRYVRRQDPDGGLLWAYTKVWFSLAWHWPFLLAKRVQIRVFRRKVPDSEINRFLVEVA